MKSDRREQLAFVSGFYVMELPTPGNSGRSQHVESL